MERPFGAIVKNPDGTIAHTTAAMGGAIRTYVHTTTLVLTSALLFELLTNKCFIYT